MDLKEFTQFSRGRKRNSYRLQKYKHIAVFDRMHFCAL